MIKNLERIYSFFFYLFVFTLPFQVDILVFSQDVYFSGFFNPYLSHFLYLSDLFLLCSFFVLAIFLFFEKKKHKFVIGNKYLFYSLLAFGLSFIFSIIFSFNTLNSVIYFVRYLEFFAVYLVLVNGMVDLKMITTVFVAGVGFQALLGICQYIFQESLGLRVIGEPILSSSHLGVAKIDAFSSKFLRVYGTFAHPNIFAGYLLFSLFLLPFSYFVDGLRHVWRGYSLTLLLLSALVLTFSRSAYLSLFLIFISGLVFFRERAGSVKFLKYLFSIIVLAFILGFTDLLFMRIVNFDMASIADRLRYISIGWNMFLSNPFGVGAGNFTFVMQKFDSLRIDPWLFQPVHNIFLLILNELGIFGLISYVSVFISYLVVIFKKPSPIRFALLSLMICVVVIGFFDHYFVSLYQGQALFWLMLWMSVL